MEPTIMVTEDEKLFGLLIHLLGIFGFIPPLVIWLLKRESSTFIDEHGKEAVNAQISVIIYSVVAFILSIILIGFILYAAIGITFLVILILASIKAYNGEYYKYPLIIRFIK